MIRFLAEADFNDAIVKDCQCHEPAMGFLSAEETGLERVPDPGVLLLAAQQDQTMPLHFDEFLMARRSSPGVFLVNQRLFRRSASRCLQL